MFLNRPEVEEILINKGKQDRLDDFLDFLRNRDGSMDKLEGLVKAVHPLLRFLREADSGKPYTAQVYWRWFKCMENVSDIDELNDIEKHSLKEKIRERWDISHRPVHAAAYALHPENQAAEVMGDSEISRGIDEVLWAMTKHHRETYIKAWQEFYAYKRKDSYIFTGTVWAELVKRFVLILISKLELLLSPFYLI